MTELEGIGNDAPPVYARAALVEQVNGRPALSPTLLAMAAAHLRRGDEPLDVALVVEDAPQALWMPLPSGLNLAGVIAEREMQRGWHGLSPDASPVALITGVAGARVAVQEGNLVILDPERGRVLVEPAAEEFARLQEARTRQRRLWLGDAHTPARTQSGRDVAVWASVRDFADVEVAMASGADGILLDGFGDIVREEHDTEEEEDEPFARLLRLTDLVGGGDITLMIPWDALDLSTIVRLAARSSLRWAWQLIDLPVPLPAFRAELAAAVQEERDEDRPAALPLLSAALFRLGEIETLSDEELPLLDEALLVQADPTELTPGAAFLLSSPLRVLLGDELDLLPEAVASGAVGVIVLPSRISVAKDSVREQAY